jgi:zinc transporter, ZIP family
MNDAIQYFKDLSPVMQALLATTFTWLLTALGASVVLVFKNMSRRWLDFLLGFTGGVMVAASFWSLLTPAIEMSEDTYGKAWAWVPAAVGFIIGAGFIYVIDKIIPHLHLNANISEKEGLKTTWDRTILLVLAITLHNIPEGLAIGVSFGAVALGDPHFTMSAAIALTIGIGIQNFPEGIAVAMPLRRQGISPLKSFWWGTIKRHSGASSWCYWRSSSDVRTTHFALCFGFCCRCDVVCGCRRSYTRNPER